MEVYPTPHWGLVCILSSLFMTLDLKFLVRLGLWTRGPSYLQAVAYSHMFPEAGKEVIR